MRHAGEALGRQEEVVDTAMNRRGFLRKTSVLGLAALVAPDVLRGLAISPPSLVGAIPGAAVRPAGYGSPALIWELTGRGLGVAHFGSALEPIQRNGWRGSGVSFLFRDPAGDWLPIGQFSEAQPDVEFWVTDHGLTIEQRGIAGEIGGRPRLCPGVRYRYQLQTGTAEQFELDVEFPAEAATMRGLEQVLEELNSVTAPVPEPRIYQILDELDANAFLFPGEILEALPAVKAKPWFDGEIAEWLTGIGRDAKIVGRAQAVNTTYD